MNDSKFKKVFEFCRLLENDSIRKEIDEQIEGYLLEGTYRDGQGLWCIFTGTDNTKIILTVYPYRIWLSKQSNNMVERIYADEALLLLHQIIEKRPNGVIYSNICKNFNSNKDAVLRYLIENRYVFTKETLESYFTNFDFEKMDMKSLMTKLTMTQYDVGLGRISDYHSDVLISSVIPKGKNDYLTVIYLNDEDISNIYKTVEGPDRVYKIYDLYRGIINIKDEKDIDLIRSGILSQDAYDLKGLKGITEKEDSIVGKPLDGVHVPSGYVDYLKQLVSKYGYNGDLQLDRDSVLAGILFKDPKNEYIKRLVELKLGISYDEYEKLDIEEQHKLIEQKIGRKVSLDYKLHIDGIPIDDEHVITRQQVDKRIDGIVKSKPKRLLRRLFGRK